MMDENGEQGVGNELDEVAEKENEPFPKKENPKDKEKKNKGKKRLVLPVAIGICFLCGTGYLYLKKGNLFHLKEKTDAVEKFEIPKNQIVTFRSFLIPLKENVKFTYVFLSISFNLPNKQVMREMLEKEVPLRGIIYDILKEEINRVKEVPPFEDLKAHVKRGVDGFLSSGQVSEAYIDQFLAV